MATWKIGAIDGAIFIAVWSCIALAITPLQSMHIAAMYIIPVALTVSFLGRRQAISIQQGRITLLQAAIGGAKWGAALSSALVAITIATEVNAAGGHLDGQALFSRATGQYLLLYGLPIIFTSSLLGALHAVCFFKINLRLVGS
ncbi:MAG: hypothetical protein CFE49_01710 [Pseudomonas sp. PGPPP3]|nr:MAG: hypothetical protein CFE49_01710 [Pseudomonas sp. PGPPP3]